MTQSNKQTSNAGNELIAVAAVAGALILAGAWVAWGLGIGLLALGVAWGLPAALVGVIREWKTQRLICTTCLKEEAQQR